VNGGDVCTVGGIVPTVPGTPEEGGVAGLVMGVVAGVVAGTVAAGPAGAGGFVRELPGAADATTAVTAPMPATEPATSHFVSRETRCRPESRSSAPNPATVRTSCS
jgi:hypothetical protein